MTYRIAGLARRGLLRPPWKRAAFSLRMEVFQASSGGSSLVIKPLTNTPHGRCGDHYASCELEGIFASILGFLSGLSDAGHDTHEIAPAAPGLGARRASARN